MLKFEVLLLFWLLLRSGVDILELEADEDLLESFLLVELETLT